MVFILPDHIQEKINAARAVETERKGVFRLPTSRLRDGVGLMDFRASLLEEERRLAQELEAMPLFQKA